MNAHMYIYTTVTPKCPITLSNLPVLHVLWFQIVHNYWYGLVHIALLTSLFAMCHHNCYNRNSKPWAQPKYRPEFTIHILTSDIWRYSHGRCREKNLNLRLEWWCRHSLSSWPLLDRLPHHAGIDTWCYQAGYHAVGSTSYCWYLNTESSFLHYWTSETKYKKQIHVTHYKKNRSSSWTNSCSVGVTAIQCGVWIP